MMLSLAHPFRFFGISSMWLVLCHVSSMPTTDATTCRDDPTYLYSNYHFYDCDWVASSHRCHHIAVIIVMIGTQTTAIIAITIDSGVMIGMIRKNVYGDILQIEYPIVVTALLLLGRTIFVLKNNVLVGFDEYRF